MSLRTRFIWFALGATFGNLCQIATHFWFGTTWLHPDH